MTHQENAEIYDVASVWFAESAFYVKNTVFPFTAFMVNNQY